jgi:hypothetical protein
MPPLRKGIPRISTLAAIFEVRNFFVTLYFSKLIGMG